MHQVGVVGLSYRHASIDEVARFAVPKADVPQHLPRLKEYLQAAEVIYLGTCNRVEVLYTTSDGGPAADARSEVFQALTGRAPAPGEASRILRAWTGEAALEHLFLVACGLDSAQTGEREIAAQLRGAWQAAREAGTSGAILNRMLGEALSMASRVHRLGGSTQAPSLADLAAERVQRHVAGRLATVALLGVSPMTRRCGLALRSAGLALLVVNRTFEVAEEFAQTVSGHAVALDTFRSQPSDVAALVLAAGGGEVLLDAAALERLAQACGRPPLIIDFGVPPNVDPESARRTGLPRVGMNELVQAAQEQRTRELLRLAPVRAAIDERLARLREELATRAIGPRLAELRDTFEQIAATELCDALESELRGLDAAQREAVLKLGSSLARRLAHLPIAGLRAAAAYASPEALDAFFREARLGRSPPHAGERLPRSPGSALDDSTQGT
jgi:glutamyl-tRNA reductase